MSQYALARGQGQIFAGRTTGIRIMARIDREVAVTIMSKLPLPISMSRPWSVFALSKWSFRVEIKNIERALDFHFRQDFLHGEGDHGGSREQNLRNLGHGPTRQGFNLIEGRLHDHLAHVIFMARHAGLWNTVMVIRL
jgi:hypothetical protein